jgi:D-alanyl-D-alanine carboxypeptidase/D-alanyl-D-alanine-endopeptidase (penicillin-binding protein 4)
MGSVSEPEDDKNLPVSPPTSPAPIWPTSQSDYQRPAIAPQRRFALTAAQLAADYPAFDANDGDLPREKFFRRHKVATLATSLGLVFVLLAGGAAAAGYSSGVASAAPAAEDPAEVARVTPGVAPEGTMVRTCTVSTLAADPSLSRLHAQVSRADTGDVLFTRVADEAVSVGSSFATLTGVAAVAKLGADYQLTTSVVDGPRAGSIVLVGGGDATLSRLESTASGVYPNAPTLGTLASAALTAYETAHPNEPITEIILDDSYWDTADRWNTSWDRSLQTGGYLSEVTSLQLDGDRDDPNLQVSPRSTAPADRAGAAFVTALGLNPDDVTLTSGEAGDGAVLLAETKSQPVSVLVQQMLTQNDATLAEMLARVVSVESGLSGSAASLQQAIPRALQTLALDTSEVKVSDGSGLSRQNAVSAAFLNQLMALVSSDETLAPVLSAMPIAGESGVLADRFTGNNAAAVGAISAVSGAIDGARSLTGMMTAGDGTAITFSLLVTGDTAGDQTNASLDTLAASIHGCGNNLSNL